MNKPHKHAEVIKAWADGIEIQRCSLMTNHEWWDLEDGDEPCFMGSAQWRVKPEPPAKVYPRNALEHSSMASVYINKCKELGYLSITVESSALNEVANAALRHAIDSGQLVEPSSPMTKYEVDAVAREIAAIIANH